MGALSKNLRQFKIGIRICDYDLVFYDYKSNLFIFLKLKCRAGYVHKINDIIINTKDITLWDFKKILYDTCKFKVNIIYKVKNMLYCEVVLPKYAIEKDVKKINFEKDIDKEMAKNK